MIPAGPCGVNGMSTKARVLGGIAARLVAIAAWVAAAGAGAPAYAKVSVDRAGPRVSPTVPGDWLRHPHDDKYYTESWSAVMRTAAGHTIYVTFLYTNIGVVSGRAGVNVSYTAPGKDAQYFSWEESTDDFGEDAEAGIIEIGPDRLGLSGRDVTLKVDHAEFRLSIKGRAWTDGVKMHDGRTYLTSDRSAWMTVFYHVPRAEFEGELVVGRDRQRVKGDLYLDHMIQNKLASDFTARWWVSRVFAPDHSVAFFAVRMNRKHGGEVFTRTIVAGRNGVLEVTDEAAFEPGDRKADPKGHHYDARYGVALKGKVGLAGAIAGKRLHDREAVMERLGWAQGQIASMVAGNPITYRLEGEPELTLAVEGAAPVAIKGTALLESIVNVDE